MPLQDFRTGYLTQSSSKAMFLAQIIGACMGCVLAPASFYLIYNAFPDIGTPGELSHPIIAALGHRTADRKLCMQELDGDLT